MACKHFILHFILSARLTQTIHEPAQNPLFRETHQRIWNQKLAQ